MGNYFLRLRNANILRGHAPSPLSVDERTNNNLLKTALLTGTEGGTV